MTNLLKEEIQKEVETLLKDCGLSLSLIVDNLEFYPEDDKYIKIHLFNYESNFDISIEKGHDEFTIDNYSNKMSQRHLWYVYVNDIMVLDKGFRDYKKAIKSGLNHRIRELNAEAKLIRKLKNCF